MAVCPPDAVLDALDEALAPARRAVVGPRWAKREQWHLTVQFLGPVAELEPVADALAGAAATQATFIARLGGAGAFPSPLRARVIWVGAAEGAEPMARLAAAAGAALARAGYAPEARPFRPHLTVARLRDPADVRAALEAIGPDPVGPPWPVRDLILFQSHLSPQGASYSVLGRFPLAGQTGR